MKLITLLLFVTLLSTCVVFGQTTPENIYSITYWDGQFRLSSIGIDSGINTTIAMDPLKEYTMLDEFLYVDSNDNFVLLGHNNNGFKTYFYLFTFSFNGHLVEQSAGILEYKINFEWLGSNIQYDQETQTLYKGGESLYLPKVQIYDFANNKSELVNIDIPGDFSPTCAFGNSTYYLMDFNPDKGYYAVFLMDLGTNRVAPGIDIKGYELGTIPYLFFANNNLYTVVYTQSSGYYNLNLLKIDLQEGTASKVFSFKGEVYALDYWTSQNYFTTISQDAVNGLYYITTIDLNTYQPIYSDVEIQGEFNPYPEISFLN